MNQNATFTNPIITGTSTNGPITAVKASPELIPKTGMANSKLLLVTVNDRVVDCSLVVPAFFVHKERTNKRDQEYPHSEKVFNLHNLQRKNTLVKCVSTHSAKVFREFNARS